MESQLDPIPRRFHLAGNPEEEHPETVKGGKKEEEVDNVFGGFNPEFLAEILKVKEGLIKKLHGPTVKAQTIDELHSLQKKKSAPTTPVTGTQTPFATLSEQDRQKQQLESIRYIRYASIIHNVEGLYVIN
ncbi:RmlC-like cupin domain superfamily [Sesbania bispinosa]|nr:RmlC-like cupin domain superfamily [Sesbania bispinosa]